MSLVNKSIVVPFRPEQMLELVSDVRSYPDFIPWMRSLRIESEEESTDSWSARATAAVGFKGFSEKFTTDIISRPLNKSVNVELVKGPFKYLQNAWSFYDHPDGCEIKFSINFEFSNFVLHALMKANFDRAVSKLMDVFLQEARRRYG
ncbi:type II toxin-antitoxin system RatA family toxin [Hirschia litorea]|uniref:Type II toxin-antitoxin system RatA family toxin n=1 Tax=Hirschia litorea TaxID=1199156 RepID=A0ABW2IHF3_9PROT